MWLPQTAINYNQENILIQFIKRILCFGRENLPKEVVLQMTYEAFSNILGNTGMDQWWKDISNVPKEKREVLAMAWIKILDFAEKTKSEHILKKVQANEDSFMLENGGCEMGTFTRAELCYEIIFPKWSQ